MSNSAIRKFARLRMINVRGLLAAWKKADPVKREVYRKEMNTYFEAIERGDIKPGEPITIIEEKAKLRRKVAKEIKKVDS